MNILVKKLYYCCFCYCFLLLKMPVAIAQYSSQDSTRIRGEIRAAYDYAFNNPDTGIILARQFMQESRQINFTFGDAYANIFIADCYFSKGDYARTIYHLLTARTLCAENGITTLNQRINRPFGELYIELGDPKKAIQHQLQAFKESTEGEETAIITKGLADAYYEAGNLDSALYYAKPLFEMAGELWAATGVTLGKIYTRLGRYEEALTAFRTKAGLTYELDLVGNYLGRAIVFDALGQGDSTRIYASKALELAREKRFFKFINESSTLLAETYKNEDREKYLEYLLLSFTAKDSLYSREKMNQINNYVFADESRRRDLAAAELRFTNQKRTILLSTLSIVLLGFGGLLLRNNRIKTNSNALLKKEKEKVEKTLGQLKATQAQLIEAEQTARQLEEQEAKRLRELNELKTRLYTNITHEFRTPLTVIMGMNDNIEGFEKERKLIRRNARNLLRLINQLLDLSKLDTGILEIEWVQGDIMQYLYYLTESFYSMASDKNISLRFEREIDSLVIDFDESMIQHIIFNLLSNALKYTSSGGKVTLKAKVKPAANGEKPFLEIKVKDTGKGIPQKDLPYIFDRFYQVAGSKDAIESGKTFAGTGIGLAFTRELTELAGGKIEVVSEEGHGSEFTVLLPIKKDESTRKITTGPQPDSIIAPAGSDPQNSVILPSPTIEDKPQLLLIEDNYGVTTLIKSLLEKDYQIQAATNGREGIELAQENVPDLIITDVMMPEKDGYEVCQTLKNDERTSHIPIIMLTARADLASRLEGLETGADAYLAKPFEKKELMVRLRKLLELRRSLQEHYSAAIYNSDRESGSFPLENQFLKRILTVVENRIEDNQLTIPEICQLAQLSHTQLYRKLKALTGKTPSQFVNSIRLQRAKELILDSNLNVSEVAYQVGFSDPNYFSRMFKKEFGTPPGNFGKE